jgi:hydrogenase nickel incorporation protein HypA/HybF
MHEMALTGSIVDIVVKHATVAEAKKVISVKLRIGELRDIVDELMEKCFRYVARGTVAESSRLEIEKVPLIICCKECGTKLNLKLHTEQTSKTLCPECGKCDFRILQGNELYVEDIEII